MRLPRSGRSSRPSTNLGNYWGQFSLSRGRQLVTTFILGCQEWLAFGKQWWTPFFLPFKLIKIYLEDIGSWFSLRAECSWHISWPWEQGGTSAGASPRGGSEPQVHFLFPCHCSQGSLLICLTWDSWSGLSFVQSLLRGWRNTRWVKAQSSMLRWWGQTAWVPIPPCLASLVSNLREVTKYSVLPPLFRRSEIKVKQLRRLNRSPCKPLSHHEVFAELNGEQTRWEGSV